MSRGDVLLVHGMWSTPAVWSGFSERLAAEGWTPHAPALPEHSAGADLEKLGRLGVEDYLEVLEAAVDGMSGPPLVIGHSLGGLLSLLLAARRPVRGLALLAPASPAGVLGIRPSGLWAMARPMLRWGWWRKPFRLSRETSRWSLMGRLDRAKQEPLLDSLVFESGRVLFEVGFWMLNPGGPTVLGPITAPVKIWVGAEDRICPAGPVKKIAARLDAPLTLLEGRSHWLQDEEGWESLLASIAAWGAGLPEVVEERAS